MARRRIPRVTDEWLHPLDVAGDALLAVRVGSDAWFSWLEESGQLSFSYSGPSGTFTPRREGRHGRSYWYAYRTQDGALRKEYLGLAGGLGLASATQQDAEAVALVG